MKYYMEITLMPGAELSLNYLWSKLFWQIHYALASYKNEKGVNDIGVSFPAYSEEGLGNLLRLMASTKDALASLHMQEHLHKLSDYLLFTDIRVIPERRISGYSIYSRYQPEDTVARKARRYIKRHEGVTYDEALKLLKSVKPTPHPYIPRIKSDSTGQYFQLFIRKRKAESSQTGTFNTYGLSANASVPEF